MKKFTFFGFVMLLFCWQSYSQDTCASATPVTPGTITGTTITDATFSADMTLPDGDNAAWFVYTATADGTIDVYSCFGGADTDLAVGSGVCGAFTDIVANDDACDLGSGSFFASEVLNYAVVAGNDYYIEWSDQWSAGPFDWTLTFTPAPDCPVPTNFAPTTQSTTTTEFTWTAGGDETSWEVGITQPDATEPDNPVLVSQAAATFGHDPGETKLYWVRAICGVGDVSEWVSLEYTAPLVDPPVNDNCDGALPLACGETINATSVGSMGTPEDSGCSMGDNGIWFTFTGTGGDMTVDTTASFDHKVAITSGACGALVNVVCDDQSVGAETHTFTSVLNETYYVYVAYYSSGSTITGTVDITLSCAVIPTCTQAVVDSSTVVESCNPDGTGTFTVDHVVSNAGDAGTVLDDGINTYPLIVGTVTTGPYNSGDSVTIDVSGVDPDCDFTVGTYTHTCPQPAPANDECVDAEPISCGDTVSGSTIDATDSGDNSSNDVWYVLAGTANGEEITASLCGSDYDTYIRVFDACGGAQVAFNDDATGVCSPQSQVTFTSDGATTYYIMVEGYSANNGNFDLAITCVPPPSCIPATFTLANGANNCPTEAFFVEVDITDLGTATTVNISDDTGILEAGVGIGSYFVGPYLASTTVNITIEDAAGDICNGTDSIITPASCPPANDNCDGALPLDCGVTINGNTENATVSGLSATCGSYTSSNPLDLFYSFVANGTSSYTVSLDQPAGETGLDGVVFIYSGPCNDLTTIECSDGGNPEEVFLDAPVAGTYFVRIFDYSGTSAFTLDLTCTDPPTCTPTTVDSSTIVGDCVNNEFSVDVVVSNVGDGTIITDGTNNYAIIAGTVTVGPYVADGTSITLDMVHSDADCDYTIGAFDYVCPPPNDEVPGAIELIIGDTMCDGKTVATNVGATTSVEAEATCGTPEGDVWFKVIVPSTGEVTIETSSSTGINPISDTVMTVYSGVSGALVEVACDDDSGAGVFSLIELTGLNPGDTLFVRVWEFGDDTKGSFDICAWSPSTLGIVDNSFEGFSYYPNPVKGTLNFNTNVSIEKVSVFNMLGQRIINLTETNIQNIDMSSLQAGAYIVQVSINNQTKTIHVIKE